MKVIVLPGLGGTGQLLAPFCEALSGSYDARGLSYDETLVTYDAVTDWVRRQLPAEDHIIVAESFSGPVAIKLAAQGVPGLRGIVCVATFARAPRLVPQFVISLTGLLPLTSRLFTRMAMPVLMGRWANTAFLALFSDILAKIPKATLLGRLNAVRRVEAIECLGRLTVPCLYLRASNDWLVPSRAGRLFDNVKTVEGPHFLLQANPKGAAVEVAAFVRQLSGPTLP